MRKLRPGGLSEKVTSQPLHAGLLSRLATVPSSEPEVAKPDGTRLSCHFLGARTIPSWLSGVSNRATHSEEITFCHPYAGLVALSLCIALTMCKFCLPCPGHNPSPIWHLIGLGKGCTPTFIFYSVGGPCLSSQRFQ